MTYRSFSIVVIASILAACASSPKTATAPAPDATEQQIANSFKEIVLEKSAPQKPDWLMGDPSFEKEGYLFFVSEGSDSDGYSLASRIAKADAAQQLVEAVSLKVKSELTKSAQRHGCQRQLKTDPFVVVNANVKLTPSDRLSCF